MSIWTEYSPAEGWAAFSRSAELTAALWDRLRAHEWAYLNFSADSSIWESRQDASIVSVHHTGERLISFKASVGAASAFVSTLAKEFGLAPLAALEGERSVGLK